MEFENGIFKLHKVYQMKTAFSFSKLKKEWLKV